MNSMARSIHTRNSSLESTNWTPAPGGDFRPFASWAETRCTTTPLASTGLPPSGSSMITVTTACSSGGISVCTKTPPALMLAAYSSTKSCTLPNRTPKRASTRGKARRGSSRGFCARDIAPIGVGGPEAEARARRCSNPAIRSQSVCGGSTNSAQYPPSGAERHSPTTAVASSACGPPGRYSLSETCVPGLGGRSEQTNTPSALTSRVVVCTIVGPAATRMGNTIGARILSFYRDAVRATRRGLPHRVLPSPHTLPMPAAARGAGGPGPCAAGVGPIPSPPLRETVRGKAHSSLRSTPRVLGAHDRLRRLRDARPVPGPGGRAPRGARAGRDLRRQPHGRDPVRRAAGAGGRAAAGHQRPGQLQGRPGPVRGGLQRARRGDRRRDRLPVLRSPAPRLRQRDGSRERLRVDARPRRRGRQARAAERRLGAGGRAGPASSRAGRRALQAARARRAHLPLPRGHRGRGARLHRRAHGLHRRGWIRGVLPAGGRAADLGRRGRGRSDAVRAGRAGHAAPRGRVPAVRQRHGRPAHAARGGIGVDRQAAQERRVHRRGGASRAEGARPQAQAGGVQDVGETAHRAPRISRAAARRGKARGRGDQRDDEPQLAAAHRARLRPHRDGPDRHLLRDRDPRARLPRRGGQDALRDQEEDARREVHSVKNAAPPDTAVTGEVRRMADYPENLKYTKEHEWSRINGKNAVIGITEFAKDQLGDVVYLELPEIGAEVKRGQPFGVVESTKAVSELFAPLTGKVTKVNQELVDAPEGVNDSPHEKGWMIEIEISQPDEVSQLLSATQYKDLLSAEER